jgi:hypothetical protein
MKGDIPANIISRLRPLLTKDTKLSTHIYALEILVDGHGGSEFEVRQDCCVRDLNVERYQTCLPT